MAIKDDFRVKLSLNLSILGILNEYMEIEDDFRVKLSLNLSILGIFNE